MASKKHKLAVTSKGIVVGGAKTTSRNRLHIKVGGLIAGVILLISLVVGIYSIIHTHKSSKSTKSTSPALTLATEAGLKDQINKETDVKKKAALYVKLATVQHLNGHEADAQASAMQATELNGTVDSYSKLASTYETKGDIPNALLYYKKTLALLPVSNNPDENTAYNYYLMKIKRLEAR